MLFNTQLTASSGTWFFWEFLNNNGGDRISLGDIRFTSNSIVYPPNMTNNTTPAPYICNSTPGPQNIPLNTFGVFDSALTGGSSWIISGGQVPFVVSLFTGSALSTPTQFSVSIYNISGLANRAPKDFKFYMGTSSDFAAATLLKSVTGQIWAGPQETRNYTIP